MNFVESDAAVPERVRIRVAVPTQLQSLARVSGEVPVDVTVPVTVSAVVDALEAAHPALAGTIRDRETGRRRPMIRIYAAGEDYSDDWIGAELPAPVRDGQEPLRLIGSIAGG